MNGEKNNEILSREELGKMNERLKEAENITLPESLSAENIAAQTSAIQQFIPEQEEKKNKRSRKKKIIFRTLTAAAAFVIAFTSVMVIKPWEKEPPIPENLALGIQPHAEDYSEIEEMFAAYSENYKAYRSANKSDALLDGFFGSKSELAVEDGVVVQNSSAATGAAGSSSQTDGSSTYAPATDDVASDYGETNEQVEGVSEADIIKNDGKYLYVVNPDNADWAAYYDELYADLEDTTVEGGQSTPGYNPFAKITDPVPESAEENADEASEKTESGMPILNYDCSISIVLPESDGSMDKVFTLDIAKPEDENIYYMTISEIYVSGDKLIALVNCSKYGDREEATEGSGVYFDSCYSESNDRTLTMAVCFDISNRAEPVESWRVYQDGSYVSSRLIGDQLVMLSDYYVDISAEEEVVKENCIPTYGTSSEQLQRVSCDCISIMENVYDTCYLVASTVDITDESTLKTKAVLGAGEDVYCTTETLYAVSTEYKSQTGVEEVFGVTSTDTQIYKFDIRNGDVKFVGSGSVEGRTLNQFSIDEYNGYLRIATTTGDWGDSLVNQLYVLDDELKVVGSIEGIAKGETIKSVRFTGDTGYVVTFEQTDPLFVIDLSDPQKPEIKGELKIPGFSTYLHPVGENLVLGVGVDGDESGQNGGMKVSLFDVSDPEKPVECDKVTISALDTKYRWARVESAAYYTHKALCWDSSEKTMYIPYGKYENVWSSSDGSSVDHKSYAGVLAVTVDEKTKTLSSTSDYISNSTEYENADSFQRVTYIGDVIFGYSEYDSIITSFNKATQKMLCSAEL